MSPALLLTALVSTAGGIVTHGIFFLAHAAYGFGDGQNLWLAVALFVPYVPAALLAGRVGRRLGSRNAAQLANAVMIVAGAVLATRPPEWGLWIAAPLYNGAAGLLWPLVEGYVAGGKHGAGLHRAIGRFNLTWSATLAPALWIVGFAGDDLLTTFGVLLALHVVGAVAISRLPADPAPHDAEAAAPVNPDYPLLLWTSRIVLPVGYVLLDALSPLLPGVWARAGVAGAWAPALASTWMVARFGVFVLLSRWAAWRGRPGMLLAGALVMLAGFALALSGGSVPVVLAGLVAFGIGQGAVYYAALYYGMAVGNGNVDSGGWHEAVIGLGYLGGPALALLGLAVGVAPIHAVGAVATLGMAAGLAPWARARGVAPT
ncbi:MAG: hypothetical protein Q8P41_17050 [Pseudomonadota bacterium]|nr:hypothetical protein [Pseudomonadota bacterium]